MEGSVQKAKDRVRVNVQLINPSTSAHLWGETYDRKLTDIFAVQSEQAMKKVLDIVQDADGVTRVDNKLTVAHVKQY